MNTEEGVLCKIESNLQNIQKIEALLDEMTDDEEKLRTIEMIGCLYSEYITGIYASMKLEEKVLEIGRRIQGLEPSEVTKENHILIVMTEAGRIGGHTAVVNNWVRHDKHHYYSLVFTSPAQFELPDYLVNSVETSGGEIIKISDSGIMNRAKKLINVSHGFERILLFTHMYDIVPMLAYSSPEWKIPILYYHHADFRFVFGLSIADSILTLCKHDRNRMIRINGISRNICTDLFPFGEAITEKDIEFDLREERASIFKRYHISPEAKLIVSMGADYKYEEILGYDFAYFVELLLRNYKKDAFFLIIGADPTKERWKAMKLNTFGKAKALGELPIDEAVKLITAADLYISSFPMQASGMETAQKSGIPALSLLVTGRENIYGGEGEVFYVEK